MSKIPKVYVTRLRARCVRAQLPANAREQGLLKPCLLWTGALDNKGYGVMRLRPRYVPGKLSTGSREGDLGLPSGIVRVHRLSFWIAFGPFMQKAQIDHKCRNKPCIEPEHLQLIGISEHGKLSNTDKALDKIQNLSILDETDEVL